jgi:hypothetical protein
MSILGKITVVTALVFAGTASADSLKERTEHTLDFIHQFSVVALETNGDVDCNEFGKELVLLEDRNFYIKELAKGTNFARGLYEKYCYHEAKFYTRENPRAKIGAEDSSDSLLRKAPWEMSKEERIAALKDSWKADYTEEEEDEITDAIFNDEMMDWARRASCSKTKNNIRCTYHAATGKGLSIVRLGEEFRKYTDSYLVCAQAAYTKDLQILIKWREGYNITHKCMISKKNFAKDRNTRYNEIKDEETSYLFNWASKKYGSAIATPKAMDAQCKLGFSDAHYCTPTMVILPTEHTYKKTVCSLETKARATNLLIAKVSSTKSKWECTSYNLLNSYNGRSKMDDNDQNCMDKNCALPYIPEEK